MSSDRIVRAVITGNAAGAIAAFKETEAAASKAAQSSSTKMSGFAAAMKNPWVEAGLAVGAVVVGVGGLAIDLANKYETTTDRMAAASGITQKQAKAIGDAFLGTAFQTTFSAQTMMEAYSSVGGQMALLAGHALTATEATKFMSQAMDLAEATGTPLNDTVTTLAKSMATFQIPLSGAAAAADTFTNVAHAMALPIVDVADAVEKLHAKLGPLGGTLPQISTLFVDLATHGLTGQRALASVSTAVNTLLSPSKEGAKEIANLRLHVMDSTGTFVGFQSVIAQLAPKLAGHTEAYRMAAENALFGKGAFDKLDATIMAGSAGWDKAAAAATKTGSAHAAAATATDNLDGSLHKAGAGIQDLLVKAGQFLMPVIKGMVDLFNQYVVPALSGFFRIIQDHLPQIEAGFRVFGEVVVASWRTTIAIATVAVNIIVAVITRIVIVIQTVVGIIQTVVGVVEKVIGTIQKVVGAVSGFFGNVVAAVRTAAGVLGTVFGNIGGFFHALGDVAGTVFGGLKSAWNDVTGFFSTAIGVVGGIFGHIGDAIKNAFLAPFRAIAWAWNNTLGRINFTIPGWVPGVGGDHFGFPTIPNFDRGGIVSSPMLATLAMNNRPEAIIPLDSAAGRNLGGGGGTVINLVINGVTSEQLPNTVVDALRRYMQMNGSVPIRTT